MLFFFNCFFFFQAEDGIRDLVRSRGLGDVYKRQVASRVSGAGERVFDLAIDRPVGGIDRGGAGRFYLSLIHI